MLIYFPSKKMRLINETDEKNKATLIKWDRENNKEETLDAQIFFKFVYYFFKKF